MYDVVKDYYGKVLQTTESLKTSACTTMARPHRLIRDALAKVPRSVNDKFYGCGSAVPLGISGLSVLDLGCGSGRDCYVAAVLVGATGRVIGVDMTEEQLTVARDGVKEFATTLGRTPNLSFVQGYIEDLSAIETASIDVVISNCVVNLSPRKDLVLREVARVLKNGGEFYFRDVYCDRRLPDTVRAHKLLWGECIAGALYEGDFHRLAHSVGFADARQVDTPQPIAIADESLAAVVGNARFTSITFRLFKLAPLETRCEDYGQVATYRGTLEGCEHRYVLDDHHVFETGRPVLVCGNTALMLSETRLRAHFDVRGDRSTHFGLFDCSNGPSSASSGASASAGSCATAASSGASACGGCC